MSLPRMGYGSSHPVKVPSGRIPPPYETDIQHRGTVWVMTLTDAGEGQKLKIEPLRGISPFPGIR